MQGLICQAEGGERLAQTVVVQWSELGEIVARRVHQFAHNNSKVLPIRAHDTTFQAKSKQWRSHEEEEKTRDSRSLALATWLA